MIEWWLCFVGGGEDIARMDGTIAAVVSISMEGPGWLPVGFPSFLV